MTARWLSNTLWWWGRNKRKTQAVQRAQEALRIASEHRRTQDQHKALHAARLARETGLRREAGDRLASRQWAKAERRERCKLRVIWPKAAE